MRQQQRFYGSVGSFAGPNPPPSRSGFRRAVRRSAEIEKAAQARDHQAGADGIDDQREPNGRMQVRRADGSLRSIRISMSNDLFAEIAVRVQCVGQTGAEHENAEQDDAGIAQKREQQHREHADEKDRQQRQQQ